MDLRKALLAIIVIGVAATASAGTLALLTDTGTSEFSLMTGSLDVEATPATLNFGDIAEGSMTADVQVTNTGSLPARQVEWTELTISGADGTDVAQALVLSKIEYRGSDITSDVESAAGDQNGNGIFDLHDVNQHLQSNEFALENMTGGDGLDPNGGETATLSVTGEIDYTQNITEDNMEMTAGVVIEGEQGTP